MAAVLLAFSAGNGLRAQAQVPTGAVVYSLPRTVVNVQVTFEKTVFTPGPYAKYAQKYLGSAPKVNAGTSYAVKAVKLIPTMEADPSARYTVVLPDKGGVGGNFLSFSRQGLISIPCGNMGEGVATTFDNVDPEELFRGKDPQGNLATVTTTLYKTVKNEAGEYEKVPVQQSQTVAKSLEKKAEETAAMILSLRQKKTDIITGDTDATFAGEALRTAIDEIDKLEDEYMSLFYGVASRSEEVRIYYVVPKAGVNSYTVCKMGNVSVSMDIADVEDLGSPLTDGSKGKSGPVIYYRTPVAAKCRVVLGGNVLTEARVLLYQLGERSSFSL